MTATFNKSWTGCSWRCGQGGDACNREHRECNHPTESRINAGDRSAVRQIRIGKSRRNQHECDDQNGKQLVPGWPLVWVFGVIATAVLIYYSFAYRRARNLKAEIAKEKKRLELGAGKLVR